MNTDATCDAAEFEAARYIRDYLSLSLLIGVRNSLRMFTPRCLTYQGAIARAISY
jgi:hypothetical protein